jgi:hypothetical protein
LILVSIDSTRPCNESALISPYSARIAARHGDAFFERVRAPEAVSDLALVSVILASAGALQAVRVRYIENLFDYYLGDANYLGGYLELSPDLSPKYLLASFACGIGLPVSVIGVDLPGERRDGNNQAADRDWIVVARIVSPTSCIERGRHLYFCARPKLGC